MHLVCLDLEGVLVPEVWIAVAESTGISELSRTTRDEPDYNKLMRYRLDLLDRHNLTLPAIRKIIENLEPLTGAKAFIDWLKIRTRTIILSDTFEQFADTLMAKLDHPVLFCHSLLVEGEGRITGYKLRQANQKRLAVEAFRSLNFRVIAVGDSYNDLSMLQAADNAILIRPPGTLRAEYPDYPVAADLTELRAHLEELL